MNEAVEYVVPTCTKLVDGKPCGAPAVEAEMSFDGEYSGACEEHVRLEEFGVTRYATARVRVDRCGRVC